jgi:y4mF family transcriptional regulator
MIMRSRREPDGVFLAKSVTQEAEELGRQVRDARRRQGMSQEELAFAADVSPRTVFAIEQGKPTVRFDMLSRVMAAVGLQLSAETRDKVWIPREW